MDSQPKLSTSAEYRDGPKPHLEGKHSNTDGSSPPKPRSHVRVDHASVGVWDFYEEVDDVRPRFSLARILERCIVIIECVPYSIRMVNDLWGIRGCALLMVAYVATEVIQGLIPVASIW